jgi:membrane protein
MAARFKVSVPRLIGEIVEQISDAELPSAASSLAYTTILSLVPLLAVSLSIFKAFGGLEKIYASLEPFIIENLAEGADEQAMHAIRGFISNTHAGTLGITGMIGLVATSMVLLASVEKAFNKVWKAPLRRPLFQRIASYWFFLTLGPLGAAALIALATSDRPLLAWIPNAVWLFLSSAGMFSLVNKYVPHRPVHWVPAWAAGSVTALFWVLARALYSLYTHHIVTYDKIYGSLGAVPILLLWVYIVWLVILGGAAIAVTLQKRFDFR